MPDTPEPLHPQDKRAWQSGDSIAITDPALIWDIGCEVGTLTEIDFISGYVYLRANTGDVYAVAFPDARWVENTSAYEINLFEWSEHEGDYS